MKNNWILSLSFVFVMSANANTISKEPSNSLNYESSNSKIEELATVNFKSNSYSCSSDGKIRINGVKTRFTQVTVCSGGSSVKYSCEGGRMTSVLTPDAPACADR